MNNLNEFGIYYFYFSLDPERFNHISEEFKKILEDKYGTLESIKTSEELPVFISEEFYKDIKDKKEYRINENDEVVYDIFAILKNEDSKIKIETYTKDEKKEQAIVIYRPTYNRLRDSGLRHKIVLCGTPEDLEWKINNFYKYSNLI